MASMAKGFGAKTITYRTAGEAAEEGEGDQDAGSKPRRGRDADRCRMGSECHSVGEREEREECSANGPRRRSGKQQVDQHRRAGLPHQRAREARNRPGGEIEASNPVPSSEESSANLVRDSAEYGGRTLR